MDEKEQNTGEENHFSPGENKSEGLDEQASVTPPPLEEDLSLPVDHTAFKEEVELITELKNECAKIIVGQEDIIEKMLVCIIADGHILLEGAPGIAKTLTGRTLAKTIDSDFSRIQFTPDLMPSDIIGTSIYKMKEGTFEFVKGPIFSNIILIDEINRAPAKTQSALFEVMEERQISFDSHTYKMDFPFLVIATQNPIEQEGTYRLPEAQLDRFLMKIQMNYPAFEVEMDILKRYKNQIGNVDLNPLRKILNKEKLIGLRKSASEVKVEDQMLHYITALVQETRNNAKVFLGASPRASLGILKAAKAVALMAGREFIIPDDIQYIASDVLSHRIILSPDTEIQGENEKQVVEEIIRETEVPR